MITALDTSVVIDVLFGQESSFGSTSLEAYRQASQEGKVIASPIVWAEIRPFFKSPNEMNEVFQEIQLEYDDLTKESAQTAGVIFREYRKKKPEKRRLIADFLIGAHAICRADRLLSRDRGFYRTYFKKLVLWDPSKSPQ